MSTPSETRTLLSRDSDFYVVGLGASAGGYEALEKFFSAMPPESGMAFVVVQHLSPDYKSLMGELLSKHTSMQVLRVEDGMEVHPNCVYLIPPKKTLTIFHRQLFLSEIYHEHGLHLPINIFFRSLAEDVQARGIGIILSGTGSDGTLGIRDIKGAGGMVMVQDPLSAKFDGMPRSAMATGLVDYVLPPEEMPDVLITFVNQIHMSQQDVNKIMKGAKVDALTRILYLIKKERNFDFTYYKPTTIIRRIEKRMGINQISNIEEYITFLEGSAAEINILAEELLINVTKFFRDPEAFEFLKVRVLPEIFTHRPIDLPIRVWVVACSTGEEAYSAAIIFQEYMESIGEEVDVKIFATDIDKPSLETASAGIYSESIVSDVSQERLAKYFTRRGNTFQVNEKIRSMVIFAYQNILKDAPFNKIDLVTCRNLLIYLQEQAQRRALSYIHFALNKDRFLLLGKSETVGEMFNHYKSVDHHWKIFKKLGTQTLPLVERQVLFSSNRKGILAPLPEKGQLPEKTTHSHFDQIYQEMMQPYEPAAVLVNERNEVGYYFGKAAIYLKPPRGRVEQSILKLVRDDLSIAVSTAIHRVRKEQQEVMYQDIFLKDDDHVHKINLVVRPLDKDPHIANWLLIIFEEGATSEMVQEQVEVYDPETYSNQRIKDLENELQITKENLQATVEELETSNEELQATNEELLAANEELQSTNEELQSVNEELITVNSEYQNKLEELIDMTNDFDNLLNSTRIATLFLDRNLHIRKFTPDMMELMNIVESDVGRPITHFSHNFLSPVFIDDLREVLRNDVSKEREVQTRDGTHYLLRILPYHAFDKVVEGVTISLINIHELKEAETKIRELAKFPEQNPNPVLRVSRKGILLYANPASTRLLDMWDCRVHERVPDEIRHIVADTLATGRTYTREQPCQESLFSLIFSPLRELGYVNIYGTEITEKKLAEAALQQFENIGNWEWHMQTGELRWSEQVYMIFGYTCDAITVPYDTFVNSMHPDDRPHVLEAIRACVEEHQPYRIEHRIVRPDGELRWVLEIGGGIIRDDGGMPLRMIGMVQDITPYKQLQQVLQARREELIQPHPPMQILLIEDDAVDVVTMERLLPDTRLQYQLHSVYDGESAFAFLRREAPYEQAPVPDLIVLDLNLPGMDGIEVMAELKGHPDWKNIAVLVLTGSDEQSDILKAYAMQSNAYLTKPYTAEQLLVGINAAMETYQFVVVKKSTS